MPSDEIWNYYQEILLAQYKVSELFTHNLVKGEAREEFLKYLITKSVRKIEILRGQVSNGIQQTGQCDCIFINRYSTQHTFGGQTPVDILNCKAVVEVKSKLKHEHIKKAEKNAWFLKQLHVEHKPLYGIFTYHLETKKNNILKKFGILYDPETESHITSDKVKSIFKEIDFIICISSKGVDGQDDTDNQFIIRKDINTGEYNLIYDYPVIKHLFTLVENL